MPRMTMFPGYDVPGPVGADYLNEEQDTIKRRRLELEKLLSTDQTKGMTGWAGGLSNLALGLAHGYHEGNLKEQEKDLSARRAEAAQKWLDRMPQDTPAQPEFQASIPKQPIVDDEGNPMPSPDVPGQAMGGMVPQPGPQEVYKPATPFLPAPLKDTAKWAMEGAGFSPLHSAIALDAYKSAQDRKKGTADKWEIKTLTKDGLEQDFWVNMNNPSQKPIPAGEGKPNQPKALQQLYDMHKQYVDADPSTRDKPEAERAQIARGLTVKAADIKIDPVTGEIVITSKPAAVAQITGGTPPATQGGGTGTQPQPAAKPPGQVPRNEKVLAVLEPQFADVMSKPPSAWRDQSLRELDDAIKRAGGVGVPGGAPPPNAGITDPDPANRPLGPGLKSAKQYRAEDPRNAQYLQQESVPGLVTRTGGMPVNAKQLGDDTEKLAAKYNAEKLPDVITATNQAQRTIDELVKKGSITVDPKTGKYLNVPGFGGPLGAANVLPAMTEDAEAMRLAMQPLINLTLAARSGAAVTDQELNRLLAELGIKWNNGDASFWTGLASFQEKLLAKDSAVTGGFAPIVRDSYFSRENVQRPAWGKAGGAAPVAAPAAPGKWGKVQRVG